MTQLRGTMIHSDTLFTQMWFLKDRKRRKVLFNEPWSERSTREDGGRLPVVGQQAVAKDEPPPLVTLQVVGPFKEPALIVVHAGQVEPRERRGR